MILGDNMFYGNGFRTLLEVAVENAEENKRARFVRKDKPCSQKGVSFLFRARGPSKNKPVIQLISNH